MFIFINGQKLQESMYLFLPKTRTDGLLLTFVQAFFDGIINGIGHARLQFHVP